MLCVSVFIYPYIIMLDVPGSIVLGRSLVLLYNMCVCLTSWNWQYLTYRLNKLWGLESKCISTKLLNIIFLDFIRYSFIYTNQIIMIIQIYGTTPTQSLYNTYTIAPLLFFGFVCVCFFVFFLYREGYQYSNVSKIYQKNLKTFVYYSIQEIILLQI